MVVGVIFWICCGVLGAMIANNKGNSGCVGILLGLILGPIGLLLTFFSSDNKDELRRRTGDTKKCPYCAEFVKSDAIVCKHCGRSLETDSNFDIERFRR